MKSKSRQCPQAHGAMHRRYVKLTKDGKKRWGGNRVRLYCPKSKLMLPDLSLRCQKTAPLRFGWRSSVLKDEYS